MRRVPLLILPLLTLAALLIATPGHSGTFLGTAGTLAQEAPSPTATRDTPGAIANGLRSEPTAVATSAAAPAASGAAVAPATPVAIGGATGTATATQPAQVAPTITSRVVLGTASTSQIVSDQFYSTTLGRTIDFLIYLPVGYDAAVLTRYPVIYELHGMSGEPDEWLRYGIREAADSAIAAGAPPFLMVFPRGDQGYWIDQVDGGPQWATYVAHDVVTAVDSHYRTLTDRGDRAIGGLSMGGHGALQIAINHPDIFGIVEANSPSFRVDADIQSYFGTREQRALRDPRDLYAAHPDVARTLILWIDYGPDDFFAGEQARFEQLLTAEGIPHQFHQYPGGHTTEYWTANVGSYLAFFEASFAQKR